MPQQQTLTPEQKRQERLRRWQQPAGVQFASDEVAAGYRQRVQNLIDVLELRRPQWIPVCPMSGCYPFVYAGITLQDAMYDHARLSAAMLRYHTDFQPDFGASSMLFGLGGVLETLDYKLYHWPGHGIPANRPYQCVEDEYMKADEYDHLLNDPSDFFMRCFLPRIFGALEPFRAMAPLTDILEIPSAGLFAMPFGLPAMQQTLRRLLAAGDAAMAWIQTSSAISGRLAATLGLPTLVGGFTKAPFDCIGDTMRGTRGIMLDLYRQPRQVLAAVERFVPLAIEAGVRSANASGCPLVMLPLHKGADAFMSRRNFEKFYWPTLKAVVLGLIEQGVIPYLFVEGSYNQRLDLIRDPEIPAGKTFWVFDRTDLREVKKHFTGWACIGGNVPVSMLVASTPDEIRTHVRDLLRDCGGDGGYVLTTGAPIDDARAENVHALIAAGREFGVHG
ncbi:MAG: uroporphyrinogen decarboxylase [Gammaproteobacteria bacterium]|nr:uroporphyrinogen decarboxylase [Gammaproteobacteria bacterium]